MISEEIIRVIESIVASYGLPHILFIFVLSLVSNSIPFIAVPYLYVLFVISSVSMYSLDQAIVITLVSALGAALGKLVIYFLSRSFRILLSRESKENIEIFKEALSKGIFFAVLIFAMTPLPDDVVNIPTGLVGFNVLKYFIAVIIGKTVLTFFVVIFGSLGGVLSLEAGEMSTPILITYIAITIILSMVIVRVNWVRIVRTYNEKGLISAITEFINQVPKALTTKKR